MTFQSYLQSKCLSEETISKYVAYLADFTAWLQQESLAPGSFTYNDLVAYMQDMRERGRTQRTIRMMMGILRHYGDMLVADGQRDDNPAEGLYVRGVRR